MDIKNKYENLYTTQDRVLKTLSELDNGFYLTGGTCIHRFYINRRYSDDLDFFCNDNDLFRDYARESIAQLRIVSAQFEIVIDTRDFIRTKFNNILQIDFVNDRVFRLGRIEKIMNQC